ncbi:MAG: hypothetical protein KDK55_05990 [Chlamydiia bacterium]|nr:hypothetical protein [Chlamydiia bacterium]
MSEKKLIALLSKKRGFFEAILDLTENESFLEARDWASSLEQKNILLSCIEDIDKELISFKDRMSDLSSEVIEELDLIKQVVARILHIDQINQVERKKQLCFEPLKKK